MKPSVRNNSRNRGVQKSQVSILGPVGYGPTMWVKIGMGVDILHGHDSQACQRISLSVMSATTSIPRARDEENHFPAHRTRRTIRQGSRPSVAIGMSSTMVTGSC